MKAIPWITFSLVIIVLAVVIYNTMTTKKLNTNFEAALTPVAGA